MPLEVTQEAVEVLGRSLALSGIDPASGGIRLRVARGLGGGTDVQVELAEAPLSDETVVETGAVRIFVDPKLEETIPDAVVAVEPQHETVVVRPAGQG